MFTPPNSPLPRDFRVTPLDTTSSTADYSSTLTPSADSSSPSQNSISPQKRSLLSSSSDSLPSSSTTTPTTQSGHHSFRHATSQLAQSIALSRPPGGKKQTGVRDVSASSSSIKKTHARNSTIAVLAGDKAALDRAVSSSNNYTKKAQGRVVRLLAFVVPLLFVVVTLIAQRWRTVTVTTVAPLADGIVSADHELLWRRQDRDDSTSASVSASNTNTLSAATPSPTPGTRIGDVPPAPADDATLSLPTPFPQPFDSTLGKNFTSSSCSSFFSTFTQSRSFRSCRSFGMLLANSQAWFNAARDATPNANKVGGMDYMNSLVWGTCHTNTSRDECANTMAGLEGQIRTSCRDELRNNNAITVAALVGFSNWKLYRDVGCITNPRTNAYCYLEALNNADAQDSFLYSLPLGIDLDQAKPTCSRCAQAVLGTFREYASNATLPISHTYPPVQNATTQACGEDYALPADVTSATVSNRSTVGPVALFVTTVLVAFVSMWV